MTMLSNETLIAGGTMNVSGQRGPKGDTGDKGVMYVTNETLLDDIIAAFNSGILVVKHEEVTPGLYMNYTCYSVSDNEYSKNAVFSCMQTTGSSGSTIWYKTCYIQSGEQRWSVVSIGGITVPQPASLTGTYVLKSVNGTLTWVQE